MMGVDLSHRFSGQITNYTVLLYTVVVRVLPLFGCYSPQLDKK